MNADSKRTRRPSGVRPRRQWGTAATALMLIALLSLAISSTAPAAEKPDAKAKLDAAPAKTAVEVVKPIAAAKAAKPKAAAAKAAKPKADAVKAAKPKADAVKAAKPKADAKDAKAPAPKPKPKPEPKPINDGGAYSVSKFVLSYGREHPDHPAIAQFLQVPIVLGKMAKGYVAPRPGVATETIRMAELAAEKAPRTFHASAIRRINEQIVSAFNRLGVVGIWIAPHQDDLDIKTGQDKRAKSNTVLRLVIWSATVSRVRTLAAGERIAGEDRIDNPAHERVREHSPLKEKDVLNKGKLDDYVFFLNRHPGRRVDVAVTSGQKTGEVALDYLVSENKPWLAYLQTSNTGTESTSKWRHRFGFIHNQLTGNDDILAAEYTTSGIDEPEAQSASGSYEAPFFGMDRLRWRAYGSWSRFEATVNSGGTFGENFNGHEWRLGGEMIANVFQDKQLFVDALAGVTWWHILVNNDAIDQTGEADAFLFHTGLRLERMTDVANTLASVTLELNCPSLAGSDEDDYERLGRTLPDGDWVLLRWDLLQSFYIEPLLDPDAWKDVSTPKSSTLAHELAFQFRGQFAMDGYRMIPQNERVIGGFFTVRGYPESTTAGDTAVIATAEYRMHIPRMLNLQADPSRTPLPLIGTPFRWAPQTVYGRPDWDLIFRTFFDVGRVSNVDRMSFEEDFTLMGAGIGVELQFTPHFNVRCDWGVPLRDMDSPGQTVQAGDHRFHFVATVLY